MNNVNSPNGQGGFQSGSFRLCDCAIPEPRMKCSENGNTSYCAICSRGLRFNPEEFLKNIKASKVHFLDTPAGRKWENIVSWRIAQKENKKKETL